MVGGRRRLYALHTPHLVDDHYAAQPTDLFLDAIDTNHPTELTQRRCFSLPSAALTFWVDSRSLPFAETGAAGAGCRAAALPRPDVLLPLPLANLEEVACGEATYL